MRKQRRRRGSAWAVFVSVVLVMAFFTVELRPIQSDAVAVNTVPDFFEEGTLYTAGKPLMISENNGVSNVRFSSTDDSSYYKLAPGSPYGGYEWASASCLVSKKKLSNKLSWKIECDFYLPTVTNNGHDYGAVFDIVNTAKTDYLFRGRLSTTKTSNTVSSKLDICDGNTVKETESVTIPANGSCVLSFAYNASDKTIKATYGSASVIYTANNIPSEYYLQMRCRLLGSKVNNKVPTGLEIRGVFGSFGLTKYDPEIISTELIDPTTMQPITGVLNKGDKVIIKTVIKNTAQDGEDVKVYLKPSDQARINMNGLRYLSNSEPTGQSQEVKIDNAVVAGDPTDPAAGLPINLKGNTPATVTYWAEVTGELGTTASIEQMIEDDIFGSKQYDKAELPLPLRELDKKDPEAPSDGGFDYTMNKPSVNNWYNGSNMPQIGYTPGDDFQDFYLDGNKLTDTSWTYAGDDTDGTEISLQAKNSEDANKISTISKEKFKVDSEKPEVKFLSRNTGTKKLKLQLTDTLSGLWMLHVTKPDGTEEIVNPSNAADPYTYELDPDTDKGPLTDTMDYDTSAQEGLYIFRAEDAAGNLSEPIQVNRSSKAPEISAKSVSVKLSQVTAGSRLDTLTSLKITDDTPLGGYTVSNMPSFAPYPIDTKAVKWELEPDLTLTGSLPGKDIALQTGDKGQSPLAVSLPVGTYRLNYSPQDNLTDEDGNTPESKEVLITVKSDGAPLIPEDNDTPSPVPDIDDTNTPPSLPEVTVVPESGLEESTIKDSIKKKTDPDSPVNNGKISPEELEQLFDSRYPLVSKIPAPNDQLMAGEITILKQESNGQLPQDVTDTGIDTTSPGSYVISRTYVDAQGNKTYVILNYELYSENTNVTPEPEPTPKPGPKPKPTPKPDPKPTPKPTPKPVPKPEVKPSAPSIPSVKPYLPVVVKEVVTSEKIVYRNQKAAAKQTPEKKMEAKVDFPNQGVLYNESELKEETPLAGSVDSSDGSSSGGAAHSSACYVHLIMLAGVLLTLLFTSLRLLFGKRRGIDYVVYLLTACIGVVLLYFRRCSLDFPVFAMWMLIILICNFFLAAKRREEGEEEEQYIEAKEYR